MQTKYVLIDYATVAYNDYESMRMDEVCEAYNDYYCDCIQIQKEPISFFEFEKGYKYNI